MKYYNTSFGVEVKYGYMPSGLVDGFDGDVVYYFKTNIPKIVDMADIAKYSPTQARTDEEYREIIKECIAHVRSKSFDHWQELRDTHIDAPIYGDYNQVTLVNFRIKDSY